MSLEWQYKQVNAFTGGINTVVRSDALPDNEIPAGLNLLPGENSLTLARGYNLMTTPLSTGLVSDVVEHVKLLYDFEIAAGGTVLLMFTDVGVYKYSGSAWVQVQTAAAATNTFNNTANTLLDATNAVANGDKVKLTTDGTLPAELSASVVYYVVGRTASLFQVALTSGGAAVTFTDNGSGTHTYIPAFGGSSLAPIRAATYTPSDAVVFTNGVDPVQIYEESTGAVRALGGLTSGAAIGVTADVDTCREVVVWNTRILLLNTTEDGVNLPQQIRWSDVGNIEDFTGTGISDAGYNRLADKDDAILQAEILGDVLIVYRDNSIVRGTAVGSSVRTFQFREVVSSEGLFSPNGLARVLDSHFFIGNNNIYQYRGGQSLEPVGDKIYPLVFGSTGLLDFSKVTSVLAKYIHTLRQVWFCLWVGTTTDGNGDFTAYKTTVLVYDLLRQVWGIREFGTASVDVQVETILESPLASDPTWDTIGEGVWEDAGDLTWSSQVFAASFPNILMGSTYQVLNQDHFESSDDSASIPFSVDTKDFTTGAKPYRFEYVDVETDGGAATLSYSVDRGSTWVVICTTTAQTSPNISRLFYTVVTKQIRFRLSGSGGGFKLNKIAFNLIEESEF